MSAATRSPVVRAIDVGYGHVKYTESLDARGAVRYASFPSQSPIARKPMLTGGVMTRRDTFLVPIADKVFEVGRDIALALDAHQETEILDPDYCLTDGYLARLYGALAYMLPGLPAERAIDRLVLGLPLNTIREHAGALAEICVGRHVVTDAGATVEVRAVSVYPQPLGTWANFLAVHPKLFRTRGHRAPMALVIDPGYNTVDWLVCRGFTPVESRSGVALRGVSAVLRAMADRMVTDVARGALPSQVVRRLDEALSAGHPFTIAGQPVDLAPYLSAGQYLIDEAAQAIRNSVGSIQDIDLALLAGGGAALYAKTLEAAFPSHQVLTLPNPWFANVRGFYDMGMQLAASAQRATGAA